MTTIRRPGLIVFTLALLLVAIAGATNVLPIRQIFDQRQEVADAQAQLDALLGQNELLEDQVDALSTPVEIERLAREQLGYVRPGETAFVVVEPEEGPAPATYPEESVVQTSEDPAVGILERIWAFLTGQDLVGE